jgi:hypothetical protein
MCVIGTFSTGSQVQSFHISRLTLPWVHNATAFRHSEGKDGRGEPPVVVESDAASASTVSVEPGRLTEASAAFISPK